jgi:phage baseplate assembly protein W
MANIKFTFSNKKVLNQTNVTNFKFKDIGTSNILLKYDRHNNKYVINDQNTSNVDVDAIKASLANILNFRNGESILDPEFGLGRVYELLYSPFDQYVSQKLIAALREILETYEPRIVIQSLPTIYSEDKGEYYVTINYIIPALNISDKYEVTLSK